MAAVAAQRSLRYEPEVDERWLRAWEPYTTLKTPVRYEHAVHATGGDGSITIARAVAARELGAWVAIVQDVRMRANVATTSDFAGVFGEPLELVSVRRRATSDPAFDHVFASFAESEEDIAALTPSLRKLLLGWRVPVHAEIRPGGFILAPVSVTADEAGLRWMLQAVHLFGDKATKVAK
jgi:hypothetical protein